MPPPPLLPTVDGDRSERPWGWFETLADGPGYRVKRLLIRCNLRISLQRHHHRTEQWVVVQGQGLLHLDGRELPLEVGSVAFIPAGAVHRVTARQQDLILIEVQRGSWLSEDDIERLDDDFGRANLL
jgi:mannose-1-phosphate guanylyltransferase